MEVQWNALIVFVVVTTFTPGPNNIAAMSQGIAFGFRSTLSFLLGIATGFTIVIAGCAIVASTLSRVFPVVEPLLRVAGTLYIVWLAFRLVSSKHSEESHSSERFRFMTGVMLQLLNPKLLFYGLTIYSTFLAPETIPLMVLSSLALAAVGFASVSTWAAAGMALSRLFRHPRYQKAITLILALLLLYVAVEVSGVTALFSNA